MTEVVSDPNRKIIGIQMLCHQISVAIGARSEELEEAVSNAAYMLAAYKIFIQEYGSLFTDVPLDEKGYKLFPAPIAEKIENGTGHPDLQSLQGLIDLFESGRTLL